MIIYLLAWTPRALRTCSVFDRPPASDLYQTLQLSAKAAQSRGDPVFVTAFEGFSIHEITHLTFQNFLILHILLGEAPVTSDPPTILYIMIARDSRISHYYYTAGVISQIFSSSRSHRNAYAPDAVIYSHFHPPSVRALSIPVTAIRQSSHLHQFS
ncbi:hypothetical protein BDV97DRAFT_54850 [Delphinella strobiligena]|nr:hypothetical protein BDV97DRAFT_54850 [Delphinella strobiligena]